MKEKFADVGYHIRHPEYIAIRGILSRRNGSIRAALVEGAPGVGKTALAESTAKVLGSPFLFHLLHSWSDDQELFCGINVAAAVAGESEHVRQPGVLAQAAELSHVASIEAPVVVCLDEIDKVQERTEYLLLDFLQSGRVPVSPGEYVQAKPENLLVFLTSNGTRQLSEPLLRRVRRIHMEPLPAAVVDAILVERTGMAKGIVRIARKIAWQIGQIESRVVSIQEIEHLLLDLPVAQSIEDVQLIFAGWASNRGIGPEKSVVAPLWAEICKERRAYNAS